MHRTLSMLALAVASVAFAQAPDPGVLPLNKDGQPLNLDFEKGTLEDWKAEGESFAGQPIKGDVVPARRSDQKSQQQGQFWIGGFEKLQDKPKGTLTSVPFKVTHSFASFLVGGGPQAEVRVELVRADTSAVFLRTSGFEAENMRRVVVDLKDHQGKEIFIRLVDDHTGHWGHINFDDFRFHTVKPDFPAAKAPGTQPALDVVKFSGLKAPEAAKAMTLPPGFSASAFASEPDVHQPVGFAIDSRGRLWVAEAHNYPRKGAEGAGKDMILIFEDTDNDGKADKRTVFAEGLNLVSGIEVGFGGVWVGQAPHLLFIPDRNGDDKPDGPPQVLLDGFGYQDTHETLNSFIWGPDGWLYGCHGVFTHSKVGKPGTPDKDRIPMNAAVWRYHPTRQVFEIFAEGGSNQWGFDFNDHGQAFMTACVIPHLYHVIQGGRYTRQAGNHFNPHLYANISTAGDHVHWAGEKGPHAGNNRSDAAGGGHAHCGAMFYLGDSFGDAYRNHLFMGNIHGNRVNVDIPEAKGSGYVGRHGKDFLLANDQWFRMVALKYGPDGSVFLIDWYDKQACHRVEPEIWDRTNGRIYRVQGSAVQGSGVKDVQKLSTEELVKLQSHRNDWWVRHARRVLQERGGEEAKAPLVKLLSETNGDVPRHLRALWALHCVGGASEELLLKELKHADAYVRGWAIQLAAEDSAVSAPLLAELTRLSKEDPSPIVRLYVASALQRLPLEQRWEIIANLLAHEEDAQDQNLPQMIWYAMEPLVNLDRARALKLASNTKIPNIRQFTARRMAGGK